MFGSLSVLFCDLQEVKRTLSAPTPYICAQKIITTFNNNTIVLFWWSTRGPHTPFHDSVLHSSFRPHLPFSLVSTQSWFPHSNQVHCLIILCFICLIILELHGVNCDIYVVFLVNCTCSCCMLDSNYFKRSLFIFLWEKESISNT